MKVANSKTIRALYVSAFIPDEEAPHAGGQAAFQNRLDLIREGYQVRTLVCTTEEIRTPPGQDVTVFKQNPATVFHGYLSNLLAGRTTGFLTCPFLDTRSNVSFERALRQELRATSYEIIFADFTQAIAPVLRALRGLSKRPVLRCCCHDLFVQKLLRVDSVLSAWLVGHVARKERQLLQSCDEVITLSDKDLFLARHLYGIKGGTVRAWTAPRWTLTVKREPDMIHRHELLFFANFERPENAEAAQWLLKEAWPVIQKRVPTSSLVLAGYGGEKVKLPLGISNVKAIGFIQNPAVLFERCHIAIAPLAYGAGVKFKVLEALACGITVVGTSVALEGIARSPATIEADRESFAAAAARALTSASHNSKIIREA